MPHENFVATDWLAAHLGEPDLGVIDASWHLPPTGRAGDAEFLQGHIPGAVFFNIDVIADTSSGLPHMLPDADAFAKAMTALGLGDGMRFVVYDTLGLFAAARVWWTLRAYGAGSVDPRRRVAEVAARGPADRGRRGSPETPRLSRRGSTPAWSPRSTTCARRWRAAPRRSSMRGPRTVSRAARPSRAPA